MKVWGHFKNKNPLLLIFQCPRTKKLEIYLSTYLNQSHQHIDNQLLVSQRFYFLFHQSQFSIDSFLYLNFYCLWRDQNDLSLSITLRKHIPWHSDSGMVVPRIFDLVLTLDPLLPVLVPGLDEVHGPRPAVASNNGQVSPYEANPWHHSSSSVQLPECPPGVLNLPVQELDHVVSSCSTNHQDSSGATDGGHTAAMLNLGHKEWSIWESCESHWESF